MSVIKLTPHFSLEEFEHSDIASRHGVPNTCPPDLVPNLMRVADFLERLRNVLAAPIIITSGYRCKWLNDQLGSHDTSAHRMGFAADFRVIGYTPLEVCHIISDEETMGFDQLIYEYRNWTHISVAPRMRREVLTINAKHPGGVPGLVDD